MIHKYTHEVKEELEKISPLLAGLPKRQIGGVPSGYFEDVEEKIMSQIFITDFDTKLSFPPGYFKDVEYDIMVKAGASQNTHNLVSINKYRKYIIGIAAMIILVLTAWFVFRSYMTHEQEVIFSNNDEVDYLQYVHDNVGDFDINMLVEYGLIRDEDDIAMDDNWIGQYQDDNDGWLESDINIQ